MRIKDLRSFARAREVARAIVAERHDRPSLVSNIACDVAAEIIEGQRSPGDDLNSVELSRRFRTSRTPIREALMLLEKEGLVQISTAPATSGRLARDGRGARDLSGARRAF